MSHQPADPLLPWFREVGTYTHAMFTGPRDEVLRRIWRSTCCVRLADSKGSGFLLAEPARHIVTNAHVVSGSDTCTVLFMDDPWTVTIPARLVAIDYPHDLALLQIESFPDFSSTAEWPNIPPPSGSFGTPRGLELGEGPAPGDEVRLCGCPLEATTPRLARGMVSGYDTLEPHGYEMSTVVLDGSMNHGSSGGPICDARGRVVGVAAAMPATVLVRRDPAVEARNLVDAFRHNVRVLANTGIGFAIDPGYVQRLLSAWNEWTRTATRVFERFTPAVVRMAVPAFHSLQRAFLAGTGPGDSGSVIGVYSYHASSKKIQAGWHNLPSRELDAVDEAWHAALARHLPDGGSFFLRGYDVLLYRQKYKGFVVPFRVEVTEAPASAAVAPDGYPPPPDDDDVPPPRSGPVIGVLGLPPPPPPPGAPRPPRRRRKE